MADQADLVLKVPTEDLLQYRLNARRKYLMPEGAPGESFRMYDGKEKFLVRTALVRSEDYKAGKAPKLVRPEHIAKLCKHLALMDQEYIVTIAVNAQQNLLAIHEAAIGGRYEAQITVNGVIKVAILSGAAAMFMVHNHPSGDPHPSDQDKQLTIRATQAADCVGVTFLDHIIVADDGFYSIGYGAVIPWSEVP